MESGESGLTAGEVSEARLIFTRRASAKDNAQSPTFDIEEVDMLLRGQFRMFMNLRSLWALFLEIDVNANGKVELSEFVAMVAKVKGKSSMSREFYLRSLPRTLKERFCKVFDVLSDGRGWLSREDIITACRQLHSHVDTDSQDFGRALDELNDKQPQFSLEDFLVIQAKIRRAPPEIDLALLSLTLKERDRLSAVYKSWREASTHEHATPGELRNVLNQLGHPLPLDQVRRLMAGIEAGGSLGLREFLYMLVTLGHGSNEQRRRILEPCASYEEAFQKDIPLEDMWELGYDDLQAIRLAGWGPRSLLKAGFAEVQQLRQAGYSARELRKAGLGARELRMAGYPMEELRYAGYGTEVLLSLDTTPCLSPTDGLQRKTSQ